MKIEYQKPWFLKPKLTEEQTNIITRGCYSINITFKVDKSYNKDNKIGFFGIPGKNFGISFDYEVEKFVFEYWTTFVSFDNPFIPIGFSRIRPSKERNRESAT